MYLNFLERKAKGRFSGWPLRDMGAAKQWPDPMRSRPPYRSEVYPTGCASAHPNKASEAGTGKEAPALFSYF